MGISKIVLKRDCVIYGPWKVEDKNEFSRLFVRDLVFGNAPVRAQVYLTHASLRMIDDDDSCIWTEQDILRISAHDDSFVDLCKERIDIELVERYGATLIDVEG